MSGQQKLDMRDAGFIRVFYEFGISHGKLAREYEVHTDTIRNVLHGKSFNPEAPPPPRSSLRKLSSEQVRMIRRWHAEGESDGRIRELLGGYVTKSTIRQVISGKTYKDVT